MRTKSVLQKLGYFRVVQISETKWKISSRHNDFKYVSVTDQSGNAICLPMVIEPDGNVRVEYHPHTIKSMAQFLAGEKKV